MYRGIGQNCKGEVEREVAVSDGLSGAQHLESRGVASGSVYAAGAGPGLQNQRAS